MQVSLNSPEAISDKADAVKLDQRNHALSKAIKKVLEYVKLTTYKLKGVT